MHDIIMDVTPTNERKNVGLISKGDEKTNSSFLCRESGILHRVGPGRAEAQGGAEAIGGVVEGGREGGKLASWTSGKFASWTAGGATSARDLLRRKRCFPASRGSERTVGGRSEEAGRRVHGDQTPGDLGAGGPGSGGRGPEGGGGGRPADGGTRVVQGNGSGGNDASEDGRRRMSGEKKAKGGKLTRPVLRIGQANIQHKRVSTYNR